MSQETEQQMAEPISEPTVGHESTPLEPEALGLACGLFWASGVALLGVTARFGWGKRWERLLADMYRGFSESLPGLTIGAAWAFVDAFTSGYIVASLYNRFLENRR
ncbi:bacteriophage holin [Natrinema gelatinilyticum]|uniref:bacteriophage holin n=1 Tax=Natrinema gelatinilyticum TaxID=2961571 RepID=UPI0020C278A3|nr:bacteriophage holin [Natrinema gelatinilyticum]